MPPGGVPYTLVGFAAELDWRPLRFVKPIPGNKLCRACGLVCRKTALLPCLHLLCEFCYEQSAQDGERVCPLDEQHCQDEEVDWKETPANEILRREVKCWSEGRGCAGVMAASEIFRHFQRQCEHHSVSCPKCSATVTRNDVCAHLRSQCRLLITPVASECEGQFTFKDETAIFLCFRRALEEQACEMRAFLERLPVDRGSRDDRLNEICHSINALNETLRHEQTGLKESLREQLAQRRWSEEASALNESLKGLPELMRKCRDSFMTSVSEVVACNEQMKEFITARICQREDVAVTTNTLNETLKNELVISTERNTEKLVQIADAIRTSTAEAKERSETTLQWTKELLWMNALHRNHCTFFVRGVKSFKEAALKNDSANYFHEKIYLRGYYISPGVKFKKEGDSATLHVIFQLHKGEMDDSVTWPFAYNVRLSVVHPVSDAEREIVVRCAPFDNIERPASSSNGPGWAFRPLSKLEDLTREGYSLHDRLRVKFQLLL